MNLIEQFGYEKAKDALDQLKREKKDLLTVGKTVLVRAEIEQNLLEHRRQHNIFEVGDRVVFKDVEKFKDNMLQVAHVELQKVLDIKSGLNGYTSFDEIRHAEPEELEAGKRLEVKSGST
ncbi:MULTISPECIES: hypothetical protein [unclassified Acinetobacter]|uniref:hypothetical protein n=1 Tax=unclassified Acinetobacter TaxID=196816 RepID=UPI0015D2F313|nr:MULTISPECIES: hypothetical protein [unclassified Acinetobacter]